MADEKKPLLSGDTQPLTVAQEVLDQQDGEIELKFGQGLIRSLTDMIARRDKEIAELKQEVAASAKFKKALIAIVRKV